MRWSTLEAAARSSARDLCLLLTVWALFLELVGTK